MDDGIRMVLDDEVGNRVDVTVRGAVGLPVCGQLDPLRHWACAIMSYGNRRHDCPHIFLPRWLSLQPGQAGYGQGSYEPLIITEVRQVRRHPSQEDLWAD